MKRNMVEEKETIEYIRYMTIKAGNNGINSPLQTMTRVQLRQASTYTSKLINDDLLSHYCTRPM